MDDKPTEMEIVARQSRHEGHTPTDARTILVENIAGRMCDWCAHGSLRWRDRDDTVVYFHNEEFGYEAVECEASRMLAAAADCGVPLYTGADLVFYDPEH